MLFTRCIEKKHCYKRKQKISFDFELDNCIYCACLSGVPEPEVEVSKDGESIDVNSTTSVAHDDGTTWSYDVTESSPDDSGKYTLEARSDEGTDTSDVIVR